MTHRWRLGLLGGLLFAEIVAIPWGVIALPAGRFSVLSSYTLTNTGFGVSFGLCGLVVAAFRPRLSIGWLLLIGGLAHLTGAALAPWVAYGADHGWPRLLIRALVSLFMIVWPFGALLLLPLALLVFPTGSLLSRRWGWVVGLLAVSCLGIIADGLFDSGPALPGVPPSLLAIHFYHRLDPLWTVVNALALPAYGGVLVSLVVRYRRGDELVRRQLRWMVFAAVAACVINLQRWVTGDGPILTLLAFEAIPLAIAVSILRHQLLDIRLVVSRALIYLVLTGGVVGLYVGAVALFDALAGHRVGIATPAVVAIALALAFNPLRLRLQRLVDRFMYGERADPLRLMSRVGTRLAAGGDDRAIVADTIRDVLRLPYAAIRVDGRLVESGVRPEATHAVDLGDAELVVGLRYGENRLSFEDARALELMAAPLAVALRATALSEELSESRERIIAAREEERRRLRRDLHDGLGPALTGVAFTLDATGNVLRSDPGQAEALLAEGRARTTEAIADIRRLVYALRPPALDELGLVGALRTQVASLGRRVDGTPLAITLDAPDALPDLPAAVEVAAYRIAVEALTNVGRHATASAAVLSIRLADAALDVEVADDGASGSAWQAGVGLVSMRERAAEVGGTCTAGPRPDGGGRVRARLPCR